MCALRERTRRTLDNKSVKDEMLSDAIKTALKYSHKIIIYKRVVIALSVVIGILTILLVRAYG